MRAVVQRVKGASVRVAGDEVARIHRGLLVLVGFHKEDTEELLQWTARKIVSLRLFEDSGGRMNLDLEAAGGGLLVVSQFTLYGDCTKGRRPSFDKSAAPDLAEILYNRFIELIGDAAPCEVRTGIFQEHMEVSLLNDGPVTLIIEKEAS